MEKTTLAFLILFMVDFVITILACAFFLRRCYLLNRMANQRTQHYTTSFIIKSSLLCLFLLCTLIELILSQTDSKFWLYDFPEPALVLIIPILAAFVQQYLIYLELKKREKASVWHRVYWLYQMLVTITMTVLVFVLNVDHSAITIPIVKIAAMFCLLIYTTFMEELPFDSDVPLVGNSPTILGESTVREPPEGTELTPLDRSIFIEFNSVPNIHYAADQVQYEFSIAVYVEAGKPHIISRFQRDFEKLQKEMEKVLHHSQDAAIPKPMQNGHGSRIAEGEHKVKMYEEYLIKLTKSTDYYVEPLLDFLEVTGQEKQRLLQLNKRGAMELSFSINDLEPSLSTTDYRYFSTVEYRNGLIHLGDSEGLILIEDSKTVRELQDYQQLLTNKGKLKMPIILSGCIPECISFIDHCANNIKYWIEFARWLGVPRQTQVKVYRMIEWYCYGFDCPIIQAQGYELVAKSEGETITMYNFQFKARRDKPKTIRIKKRFNDFVKLNEKLTQYFKSKKIPMKLPSLPPKVAAFGSKTSPKSRQGLLETYLNKLLNIELINHCLTFLQFLQPDDPEEGIVLYAPSSQEKEQNNKQNLNLDDVNMEDGPSIDIDSLAVSQLR